LRAQFQPCVAADSLSPEGDQPDVVRRVSAEPVRHVETSGHARDIDQFGAVVRHYEDLPGVHIINPRRA
jgi:hypothetical protein